MRKSILTLAAAAFIVLLLLPQTVSAEECDHRLQRVDCQHSKCTLCGYVATSILPPSLHKKKCSPYRCDVCNELITATDATAHNYKAIFTDNCNTTYTCVDCGRSYESSSHSYETVIKPCSKVKRCMFCEMVLTETTPVHNLVMGACETYPACSRCGELSPLLTQHVYTTRSSLFYSSTYCVNCEKVASSGILWLNIAYLVFSLVVSAFIIVLVIKAAATHQRAKALRWIFAGIIWVPTFAIVLIPGVNDSLSSLLMALFPHRLYSNCSTTECGHCDLTLPFGNGRGHYYTTYKEIGCVEYRRCEYCGDEDTYTNHSYSTVHLDGCAATQQCSSCKHIRYVTQHNYSRQNTACSRCGIYICVSKNGEHRFRSVSLDSFDSLFLSKCSYCNYKVYLGTPHTVCMLVLCILAGLLIISLVVLSIYIIRKKKYLAIHPGLFAGALMSGQLDNRFEGFSYTHEPSILYFYTRMTDD